MNLHDHRLMATRTIAIPLAIAGLLGATMSPLWGQANGGTSPGDNTSRRAAFGQPLAPHQGRSGGGVQRGPSGAFRGLAGKSIGSIIPQRSSDADASTADSGRQGAFGERWLGQPLAPKARSAFDGLHRGASDEFLVPDDALTRFPPLGEWLGADTPPPPLLPLRTLPSNGVDSQRGHTESFSEDLSEHLTRLARAGGVRTSTGVRAYFCGDSVVLQGTVDSVQQSELVAALALLEPGVWSLDNRLTITARSASSGGRPPGRTGAADDAVSPMRSLPVETK